jgi:hypothetical protein
MKQIIQRTMKGLGGCDAYWNDHDDDGQFWVDNPKDATVFADKKTATYRLNQVNRLLKYMGDNSSVAVLAQAPLMGDDPNEVVKDPEIVELLLSPGELYDRLYVLDDNGLVWAADVGNKE